MSATDRSVRCGAQLGGNTTSGHAGGVRYGSLTQTALALSLLALITICAMTIAGLGERLDFLGAAARSIVQLVIVALIVAWIFQHPEAAWLYLIVMFSAATATSMRRVRCGWRNTWRILFPMIGGVAVAVGTVAATGALPISAQTLLPFTAQMIGGSMTAISLTGSRFRQDAFDQWHTVEGYLALGATPVQSVIAIGRKAAEHALIPGIDQTRSAGLVVLPGAFVGMLLGGASPAQAAQVQLLVLLALIAAASCAASSAIWTLGPLLGRVQPVVRGQNG